jgi:pimeloyl-ACP methyl ester carboxylesterase
VGAERAKGRDPVAAGESGPAVGDGPVVATRPDATREGIPVDVPVGDGRYLEATIRGTGGPTVIFEAGMGAGQSSWGLVVPTVAGRTRTVTYNRAGFGRSTPDPEARTVARAASDLLALIDHLDAAPAVLVAHSYGGPIVREALATGPERVAGLVLVDQTDEGCDMFFAPAVERQERTFGAALPLLARLGLGRLITRRIARPLPPDARRGLIAESASVGAARAHRRELAGCNADLRRLRDEPHPVVDVPITVISGTRPSRSRGATRRRDCLIAAHERRAAAAPQGRHVRADRSQHLVPLTEPDLVAAEIVRLLDP